MKGTPLVNTVFFVWHGIYMYIYKIADGKLLPQCHFAHHRSHMNFSVLLEFMPATEITLKGNNIRIISVGFHSLASCFV
jgi:hypothetical protein